MNSTATVAPYYNFTSINHLLISFRKAANCFNNSILHKHSSHLMLIGQSACLPSWWPYLSLCVPAITYLESVFHSGSEVKNECSYTSTLRHTPHVFTASIGTTLQEWLTRGVPGEADSKAEAPAPARYPVLYEPCILWGLQHLLHLVLAAELSVPLVEWFRVVFWTGKELMVELPSIYKLEEV